MHMNQITINNERDKYWDSVKAVLMFLVILGHTIQYFVYQGDNHINFWKDPIFKGIYIFHMPLFMFISGYFAASSYKIRTLSVIPRYFKRLALPCIGIGLYGLINRIYHNQPISPTRIWANCTALWFLISIFECLIWYIIFEKYGKIVWVKAILFILPIILALNINHFGKLALIWPHTQYFTYMWPFFIMGAYTQKYNFVEYITNHKRLGGIFIILYIISFLIFNEEWYVYRTPLNLSIERWEIHLIRTLTATTGCGAFLFIIKQIPLIDKSDFIQKIGKSTLAIYILQSIIFSLLRPYIPANIGYAEAIIISLMILVGLFYFYQITRKIPIFMLLAYGESHKSK